MLFDLHPKEKADSLYAREDALQSMLRHILSRRWVSLFGPRMVGKTSLVKAAASELEATKFKTLYVSMWGANSIRGLLDAILLSLQNSGSLFREVKKQIENLESVSVGPIGITVGKNAKPVSLTGQLLSLLGRQSQNLFVILDEVQELAAVSSHLHKILANLFVTAPNVVFCFTGSQSGLVRSLQNPGPESPLYGRSPAEMTIVPFDRATSASFLTHGFEEYERSISSQQIEQILERLGGIPGWLTNYGNNVTVSNLSHDEALKRTENEAFKTSRQTIDHFLEGKKQTPYLLALRAIATVSSWAQINAVIETHTGTKLNDGQLKTILDSLMNTYLVEKRGGVYAIIDPTLRNYILKLRF